MITITGITDLGERYELELDPEQLTRERRAALKAHTVGTSAYNRREVGCVLERCLPDSTRRPTADELIIAVEEAELRTQAARLEHERNVAEKARAHAELCYKACEAFLAWDGAGTIPETASVILHRSARHSAFWYTETAFGHRIGLSSQADCGELAGPVAEHLAQLTARWDEEYRQWDERRLASEERKRVKADRIEAERIEAERRRTCQIDEWVAAYGSENQKARHALTLLPVEEVLSAMRERAYAPLDALMAERFKRITEREVCGCEQYPGVIDVDYDVDFEAGSLDALTAEQFEVYRKTQEALPEATLEARYHTGSCYRCGNTVSRCSLRVGIKIGEISFAREYAFPDSVAVEEEVE